jgi:putative effector of murein hydrolase
MATITLVVVVATGILTSVIGPVLLDLFGIKDKV